jgi:predicted amidohydrolase YtcJ
MEQNGNYELVARRQFLHISAAAAVAGETPLSGATTYDTLIHGGRVIDASQKLDKIADVAISGGKIAAIKPNLPANSAAEVINATGKIVSPGLIDVHCHLIDPGMTAAMALSDGVTTLVDGGPPARIQSRRLEEDDRQLAQPRSRSAEHQPLWQRSRRRIDRLKECRPRRLRPDDRG